MLGASALNPKQEEEEEREQGEAAVLLCAPASVVHHRACWLCPAFALRECTCHAEEDEAGFDKLRPANKTDHSCQSWQ